VDRFSFRRFFVAQLAFIAVLTIGTLGFVALTDEGWVSSFYRSVVTTTLTGLDSRPENQAAEIFTVILLLAGVAIFLYLAGAVVELITRGVVGDYFGEGRRKRAIGQLRDHTIICGFGRVGRSVAAELGLAKAEYVVIDVNPASLAAAAESGALVVHGDGTEDADLFSTGLADARALGCDADVVAQVERDGLPVSVGRSRRTVPPALRRLLEARDNSTCCFPGCERRRHLQAHHRQHWAHGGETNLENLVLLCCQHHRVVHEGGYTVEGDPETGVRFRNRYGVVSPLAPPRPPPARPGDLLAANHAHGLRIDADTNRNGIYGDLDLQRAVEAITSVAA